MKRTSQAADSRTCSAGEALGLELCQHVPAHLVSHVAQRRRRQIRTRKQTTPNVVVLDSGEEEPQGAEKARQRRNDHPADAQFTRQPRSMDRSRPPKRHQNETSRVAASFGGDSPQGPHGAGISDAMDAFGRLNEVQAQGRCDQIRDRSLRGFAVDADLPVRQVAGPDVAQDHVGVRQGGGLATPLVTDGAGHGAGAARTHAKAAGLVQVRNASAAGSDLGNIDAGRPNQFAAAPHQPADDRQ